LPTIFLGNNNNNSIIVGFIFYFLFLFFGGMVYCIVPYDILYNTCIMLGRSFGVGGTEGGGGGGGGLND